MMWRTVMSKHAGADSREQHKRLAAQIFIQLPEDREEALIVLTIARQLVEWAVETEQLPAAVLKIVG